MKMLLLTLPPPTPSLLPQTPHPAFSPHPVPWQPCKGDSLTATTGYYFCDQGQPDLERVH